MDWEHWEDWDGTERAGTELGCDWEHWEGGLGGTGMGLGALEWDWDVTGSTGMDWDGTESTGRDREDWDGTGSTGRDCDGTGAEMGVLGWVTGSTGMALGCVTG